MYEDSNFSTFGQHMLFSIWGVVSLIIIVAILVGVKWYFIVVLIFISLMISDIEHLFICMYILYGEMFIQGLCVFFNWVADFPDEF